MTDPTPGPMLIPIAEAAIRLGVTEAWLRKQVLRNRVTHTRLSERTVRFTKEDLEAIIQAAKVEQTTKPLAAKPARQRARKTS